MRHDNSSTKGRRGFAAIEVGILILVAAILAFRGFPRFLESVERMKATEAFEYLSTVQELQRQHLARTGHFASDLQSLGPRLPQLRYFRPSGELCTSEPSRGKGASWTMSLARSNARAGFEGYTVTFTQDGFEPASSSIEHLPEISRVAQAARTDRGRPPILSGGRPDPGLVVTTRTHGH